MSKSVVRERALGREYLELCKPNVVALMILTSVIGMLLSVPGAVPWQVLIFGNLGIALCAAADAAASLGRTHRAAGSDGDRPRRASRSRSGVRR